MSKLFSINILLILVSSLVQARTSNTTTATSQGDKAQLNQATQLIIRFETEIQTFLNKGDEMSVKVLRTFLAELIDLKRTLENASKKDLELLQDSTRLTLNMLRYRMERAVERYRHSRPRYMYARKVKADLGHLRAEIQREMVNFDSHHIPEIADKLKTLFDEIRGEWPGDSGKAGRWPDCCSRVMRA